mmetsp:Transcript_25450/g.46028  ORF Transcript_25450/g.46028 Transcript_25450/m.46028 type:complete len:212 (+) Transcript_25450:440-1075(+)
MPHILVMTTKEGPARHRPAPNNFVQHPSVDRAVHRHHVHIRRQGLLLAAKFGIGVVVHSVEIHKKFTLVLDQFAFVDTSCFQCAVHQKTETILRQLQLNPSRVGHPLQQRRLVEVGGHADDRMVRPPAEVTRARNLGVRSHIYAPNGLQQGMVPAQVGVGIDGSVSRHGHCAAAGDTAGVIKEPITARPRPRALVRYCVIFGGGASPARSG